MIVGILFLTARLTELFFLIPIIGMLSFFVHGYVEANFLTPNSVLVLFIVSTIAGVWALMTALFYGSAKHNGYLLAFVDICIWGGLIAGVYELRLIASTSCSTPTINSPTRNSIIYKQLGPFVNDWSSTCNMLKACFGLAILEILFFFYTFLLSLWVHHHHRKDEYDNRRTERHYTRHSQRRSQGGSRSRSRGGGSRSGGGGAASDYYNGDNRRRGPPSRSQYNSRGSYV